MKDHRCTCTTRMGSWARGASAGGGRTEGIITTPTCCEDKEEEEEVLREGRGEVGPPTKGTGGVEGTMAMEPGGD